MDEQDALLRLKQGDILGLKTLVRIYQVQAVRAAYLITRDKGLAEEITQDAFLRVHDRIEQFDMVRPFPPWFFRIVTNLAIKKAKKSQRFISLEGAAENPETTLLNTLPDTLPQPEDEVATQLLREKIWQAINQPGQINTQRLGKEHSA